MNGAALARQKAKRNQNIKENDLHISLFFNIYVAFFWHFRLEFVQRKIVAEFFFLKKMPHELKRERKLSLVSSWSTVKLGDRKNIFFQSIVSAVTALVKYRNLCAPFNIGTGSHGNYDDRTEMCVAMGVMKSICF